MWTPDQTACRSSLIWIYTVCQRGFKNISVDDESRGFVIGALRVNKYEFIVFVMLLPLFIAALWSPAGKGLTSWILFVMSNCDFVLLALCSNSFLGTRQLLMHEKTCVIPILYHSARK